MRKTYTACIPNPNPKYKYKKIGNWDVKQFPNGSIELITNTGSKIILFLEHENNITKYSKSTIQTKRSVSEVEF